MSRISTRSGVAVAVALAVTTTSGVVGIRAATADSSRARTMNVIYLLGDGMGRTHVTAGRDRFYGADGRLVMETLPAVGQVATYAIGKNSGQPGATDFVPEYVTDSASSATAWASGVKTYNAALGVDGKGAVVPTLMELAKRAGYGTGNVSTAEITDATPASQMSHALARGCQGPEYSAAACQDTEITGSALPTSDIRVTPIADQIARNGTADVILGGGLSRFDAEDEQALKSQGYSILGSPATQAVATRAELSQARGPKVFGLFNKGNLTVERAKRLAPGTPGAAEPSLPELTSKAISLLSRQKRSGKGFYLQVEGALIDKRSHANDAAQTLDEIKAFDDAVKVARDFAAKDRNTLVIVTADHECAGFSIIEQGTITNAEADVPGTGNRDAGNPANSSAASGLPDRAAQSKADARSTGIQNAPGGTPAVPGGAPANNFAPATFRTADDPRSVQDGTPEASLWLTYLSGNHTGEDVPIYASGPRAWRLGGSIDNTDLFDVVGGALGVVR
jgi:alkaline phosphatase